MKNLYITGLLLGFYANGIFLLGVFHFFNRTAISLYSLFFFVFVFLVFRRLSHYKKIGATPAIKNKLTVLLILLIILHLVVNLIGSLAPEITFDALWYHLTLPKIYIENQQISYIPGGLFYYSSLPQLGEMFYIPALLFGNEMVAKMVHFFFSILIGIALYKVSRKYFSLQISLLVVVSFYTNLVVSWEATVAYIDLIRTFFEFLALSTFLFYIKRKQKKYIFLLAVFLGFASATKLIAFSSVIIFSLLMLFLVWKRVIPKKESIANLLLVYGTIFFLLLPWKIFLSPHVTGQSLEVILWHFKPFLSVTLLSPLRFLNDVFTLFIKADDPISPIYITILPLIVLFYKKFSLEFKLITLYSLTSILLWYITPRTGGGRFILPYLPAFSILVGVALYHIKGRLREYLIGIVIFLSLVTILYRTAASVKYIPFLLGKETKSEFLQKNLNFSFGDFYDTDGFFAREIKASDKVLLIGFHNLYYIDFPFIHESYIRKGEMFNFIAIQNAELPERFSDWRKIYENKITRVSLYKNVEKEIWTY